MEAHLGSEQSELVPVNSYLQDGNPRNDKTLPSARRVGHLLGLQQCLLPHPASPRSRKYLRFHLNGQTYQFTALYFGLATAPLEVVKEVKLMAQARGLMIYQYPDNWLLRTPSQEICRQHTQLFLALCQDLGWVVNTAKKLELIPKLVLNFVGYRFNISHSLVTPTQERWDTLTQKI